MAGHNDADDDGEQSRAVCDNGERSRGGDASQLLGPTDLQRRAEPPLPRS